MNTPDVPPGAPLDPQATAPRMEATRPLYWSIRRELWENRSLTIAPLVMTGFVLFVNLVMAFGLPRRMRGLAALSPEKHHHLAAAPFSMAASAIMVTTILVAIFYSLDALYGERRERSILFWKSLPVSDRTTVLSKAAIPLVVMPVYGFALSIAAQFIILLWSTAILMGHGLSPAALWGELPLFQMPLVLLYGIGVFVLWHAPVYGWLLLISGWARRTPALWAVLPPMVVSMMERTAFRRTSARS